MNDSTLKKLIKKKTQLKEHYGPYGYLKDVVNPKGTKKKVAIVQRGGPSGFTAIYSTKPYRKVKGGFSRDAEALARRMARKGHKKVEFWD